MSEVRAVPIKIHFVLAVTLVSACKRDEVASLREVPLDSSAVLAATKAMHKDNPSTLAHKEYLIAAYYIEAKSHDRVWLVYDSRVGFNDSEFVYCTGKTERRFRRL